MPESEIQELIALALVFVVHVIGGLALVWALLDDDTRAGWRRRWFGGGEDEPDPTPPAPRPAPVVAPPPLPLSASGPARARLRGPGSLADVHPPVPRRPDHVRQPARAPR
jgi:hypothetical protein